MEKVGVFKNTVTEIKGIIFNNLDIEDVGAADAYVACPANKDGWYVILIDESDGPKYTRSIRLDSREEAKALALAASPVTDTVTEMCDKLFM